MAYIRYVSTPTITPCLYPLRYLKEIARISGNTVDGEDGVTMAMVVW